MALTLIKATGVDVVGLSAVIGGGGPKITSIGYLGDDTAADPAGGQTITLNGSGFVSGLKVLIGSTLASVTTLISSTQATFVAPVKTAGSYILYLVNPDGGTAVSVPGLEYSGVPNWSTAAGFISSVAQATSMSVTIVATSDSAVSYTLFSGTLPAGVTLNSSTGVISGTTPTVASDTTYNFVIRATDAQNQDTDRSFSITVSIIIPPSTVEYLVVGGGGSSYGAAAGGAGGLLTGTGYSITAGSPITVTIGTGGVTGGYDGTSSVFGSISTYGGGGGGLTGRNGGSGGGSGYQGNVGGKGVYPGSTYISANRQGYDGGIGYNGGSNSYNGGGGGGAGAVGSNGAPAGSTGGNGGIGVQSSITGTATYYAGGGGGAGASTNGIGGLGGGANANGGPAPNNVTPPLNGTTNTGGGGGGGNGGTGGGLGGSGIVIIRYPDTFLAAASTTGSPTITVAGGYRVYKFTASGSITF